MRIHGKYAAYEELAQFLGSYFHQDMGSPTQALEAFIRCESQEYQQEILNLSKDFIASTMSDEEKTAFIENYCEIYFKGIGTTALKWYEEVIHLIEDALDVS